MKRLLIFENFSEIIFKQILKSNVRISKKLSKEAKDILTKLLKKDPNERLGSGGAHEIFEHPFFNGLMFDRDCLVPPYVPKIKKIDDWRYINEDYIDESIESNPEHYEPLTPTDKKVRYVHGFSFNSDHSSFASLSNTSEHKASM